MTNNEKIKRELLSQIKELDKEIERIEDMREEAYKRIDELEAGEVEGILEPAC